MSAAKIRTLLLCAAAIVMLLLVVSLVPYSIKESYYCPSCRAFKYESRLLGFQLAPDIRESIVTSYWRKEVEPRHKHTWRHFSTSRRGLGSADVSCGYIDAALYALPREAEIAILSSFKTPAERLVFAKSFLIWNWKQDQGAKNEWRDNALTKLREAYKQNPDRKDWQQILKKLGAVK